MENDSLDKYKIAENLMFHGLSSNTTTKFKEDSKKLPVAIQLHSFQIEIFMLIKVEKMEIRDKRLKNIETMVDGRFRELVVQHGGAGLEIMRKQPGNGKYIKGKKDGATTVFN